MDFAETILWYYVRESKQGFGSAIFGVILISTAFALFKFASPLSLIKGLAIPSLVIGLLMGIGGLADGYISRKSIPEKIGLFKSDRKEFFKQEVPKVEKTHQSWRDIRIFWGIFTLIGVVLFFAVKRDYWTGVAIGTFVLSLAGHTEEAISKNFNEQYYEAVLSESRKK
jgi:hypothetical protein